jgi:hypothetical protein
MVKAQEPKRLRAQAATEYVILLGAVLIIAVGVVSLLAFFPGMGSDAGVAESQLYWRGSAKPISVLDIKNLNGSVCSASSGLAGYRLVITNSNSDPIYITRVELDNTSKTFCLWGASAGTSSLSVGPGQTTRIDVQGSGCPTDSLSQFSLAFTYSTPYLEGKRQSGTKKLAFRCSEPTLVSNGSSGGGSCALGSCTSCTTQPPCEAAGCTWSGSSCGEPPLACSFPDGCRLCMTERECFDAGCGVWDDETGCWP